MTVKELRELANKEFASEIIGAHGMNKEELVIAIKKAKGIAISEPKKKSDSVREIKQKIKQVRAKRENFVQENNKKMAAILRRRISKLKKKTRRAA